VRIYVYSFVTSATVHNYSLVFSVFIFSSFALKSSVPSLAVLG